MIRLVIGIHFCAALCTAGTVRGQQITEAAASLEKMFVEACRERLLGNYDKAIPLLEELLKKDSKNHAAMYELARIHDVKNAYEPAEKLLQSAIALAPDNEWYKKFLADVFQKSGKFPNAAALYEQLVKKEPNNENYYFKWAYFLVKSDAVDRAIKVYDEYEKRTGIHEETVRRKHLLYIGLGNNKKAAEELQRLIAAYPKRVEYRHLLAAFYEQIDEKSKAEAEYRQILTLAPNDPKAALALTNGRQAANDDITYIRSLRAVFENPSANIDLKIGKLLPFIQKVADTGDAQLAAAALELTQVLENAHPAEAKPLAAAGDLLYYSGKKKEALAKYRQATALDNSVFAVWEQILSIRYELGHYEKLQKDAEEALDLFPNRAVAYFFYAAALLENGELKDAEGAIEQAMLMVGNNNRVTALLLGLKGGLFHARKAYDKSEIVFSEVFAVDPNSAYMLSNYAYYLCVRNEQTDRALTMAQKAGKLVPGIVRADHAAGWALLKKKDYAAARESLSKALQNNGEEDSQLLEHFGDLLSLTGDTNGALQYWNKAQSKGGGSALLDKKIADKRWYE
jgi:tetratricopeptide (TPR) repeat protein